MATIKDLYDWINRHHAGPDAALRVDRRGHLIGTKPDGTTTPGLFVGFDHGAHGPDIDGQPGRFGDLVFWRGESRPRWILEWQPDNGEVFALVDADGNIGMAGPEELTRDFRERNYA